MTEQEVEAIAAALASAAAIAGDIPSPASVPLLLFAGLEGPALRGIIWLIDKIKHKKNPLAAVQHAHAAMAMEPERDPNDLES